MTQARGRPSIYSEALVKELCIQLMLGDTLTAICKREGMPSINTVARWLADNEHESFWESYARAREIQAELMGDRMRDVAADASNDTYVDETGRVCANHAAVSRSRLIIETDKWLMSKLYSKRYGERVTQEHTGTVEITAITRTIVDPGASALASSNALALATTVEHSDVADAVPVDAQAVR